jgi:hypothetical protein
VLNSKQTEFQPVDNRCGFQTGTEYASQIASEEPSKEGGRNTAIKVKTMQTAHRSNATHFMRLCYDASLLLFYSMSLVLIVALGAHGLEMLFSAL